MYMFRYRRAKECKACVVNHTNSCATNITIAQPRNAPPKPNRQKAIKTIEEGKEVATFVPNQWGMFSDIPFLYLYAYPYNNA